MRRASFSDPDPFFLFSFFFPIVIVIIFRRASSSCAPLGIGILLVRHYKKEAEVAGREKV